MTTLTALSHQISVYEDMRDALETDYFGKWVVFQGGQLAGTYESFEEAAGDAVTRFGRGPYLIRRVGAGPPKLPASVLYRPVNANH